MAYDADLADRLREVMARQPDPVVEKAMFGGLAFLVAGHLVVSASSQGGLLLRAAPGAAEGLQADPRVRPFVMRGRELEGWWHVDTDGSVTASDLDRWVALGLAHVRSLPPK